MLLHTGRLHEHAFHAEHFEPVAAKRRRDCVHHLLGHLGGDRRASQFVNLEPRRRHPSLLLNGRRESLGEFLDGILFPRTHEIFHEQDWVVDLHADVDPHIDRHFIGAHEAVAIHR